LLNSSPNTLCDSLRSEAGKKFKFGFFKRELLVNTSPYYTLFTYKNVR